MSHDSLDDVLHALRPDDALLETPVSTQRVWEGRIFAVDHEEVELADGSHAMRELVRHHGGAAVVAALDGRVCLVRQYRVALGRVTLEIPAGKLELGEKGEDCAARELAEETGLVAERLVPLVTTLGSPGFTNEHTEVFLAQDVRRGEARPDEGEVVRIVWLPVDEVVAAMRSGLVQDAKTVAGILAARDAGLL